MSASDPFFSNGEKLIFPKSMRNSIMESVVVVTPNRHVIVFDGGHYSDTEHLVEIVRQFGNGVDYWFLSHAHDDHCGAIIELAKSNPAALEIRNVLYAFPPQEWLAARRCRGPRPSCARATASRWTARSPRS